MLPGYRRPTARRDGAPLPWRWRWRWRRQARAFRLLTTISMAALSRVRNTLRRSLRFCRTVSSMLLGVGLRPTTDRMVVSGLPALPLNSGSERRFSLSMTGSSVSRDLISSIWLEIRTSIATLELLEVGAEAASVNWLERSSISTVAVDSYCLGTNISSTKVATTSSRVTTTMRTRACPQRAEQRGGVDPQIVGLSASRRSSRLSLLRQAFIDRSASTIG